MLLFSLTVAVISLWLPFASGTILQNGQVKITNYPNTRVDLSAGSYNSYAANAPEISYKGRWDSKKVSFWA